MREIGVSSPFSAPDLGYSFSHSIIHSRCQDWLLRIELNFSDSEITLGAVQWAISELRRIEEQELYRRCDSTRDIAGSASSSRVDDARGQCFCGQCATVDRGIERQEFAERGEGPSCLRGPRIDLVKWRNGLIEAGGCMEEPEQGGVNFEGEKRAKVRKFVFSTALKEAVLAAEGGEAGRRMAERINSRLELPECVFLTKLVSHSLLVSLDQSPMKVVRAGLVSFPHSSSTENDETLDWMWLHRWFVRTVLSGSANDLTYIALDWLVAYLTASRGTITRLVLDDLIVDLQGFNDGDEQPPVATYIRRTGVLEYAALGKPDKSSENL